MVKSLAGGGRRRAGLRAWVVRVGSSIVIWTVVMQLMPILGPASWQPRLPKTWPSAACLDRRDPLRPNSTTMDAAAATLGEDGGAHLSPPALLPRSEFIPRIRWICVIGFSILCYFSFCNFQKLQGGLKWGPPFWCLGVKYKFGTLGVYILFRDFGVIY